MSGYFTFMRKVSWLLCVFFFFSGCGKEEPPPKPKLITKKIIMEKNAASPSATADVKKAIPDKVKSDKKEQKPLAAAQKTESPVKPAETPVAPKSSEVNAEAKPKPAEPQSAVTEKPVKPPEKPPEKTVTKTDAISPKPLEKKADIIVPDVSALEKEVQKAMAVYDPKGKTDPFAPLFKDEPKPKPGHVKPGEGTPGRILTPLEKLDLSQLKLVGIVRGIGGPRALVEETGGKGYIIKKGTYIGIHSGKVADIFDDKIVIDEEFEDYTGNELDGWERHVTVRKREMKLQKSPGDEL
jgi:type IV pilus assembly protein PilP